MKKLHQLLLAMGVLTTSLVGGAAHAADTFPERPITLVVPWNAGGSVDLTGRKISDILGREGVKVVVENLAGASSTIGLSKVAKAAPDGYTVGLATSSLMGVIAQDMTKLRVDDFTALNQTTVEQLLLVVPASSPANTIEEFVKLMKEKNGSLSIGTPGNNNVNHTFASMLANAVGVEYTNIPYTGGAKVLVDLGGSHIDAGVLKPSETIGQIKAGLIKPIGVFSKSRVDILPDVPTFEEKKIDVFPYGALEQMSYLVAPKGLPDDVAGKLRGIFGKAIQSPAYQEFAAQYGMKVTDLQGDALQKEAVAIQETFNTVAPKIFVAK
ncbi:MAG TPA: tripartite tricarboxylate transporter substrate binding protein [Burkholderiaceae bacterium]|nr:tripartite tricarboxylate transporter substrate binding protein [Burkholderiaceae bacterium]